MQFEPIKLNYQYGLHFIQKNIPILLFCEDSEWNITEVKKVFNVHHLPPHLFSDGMPSAQNEYALCQKLEDFFNNRIIPYSRKSLKEMLSELEITSAEELAKRSFYLSLSDQYWFCPKEDMGKIWWEDINFFTKEYDSAIGLRLINNSKSLNKNSSSVSPDSTTGGELPKRWVRENNINYLEKAGTGTEQKEPLNEVLASEICRRLKISHIPYTLEIRDENYYCRCADIANEDRHAFNISILRNSDTLEWIDVAPVYDSGKSMFLNKLDFEIKMISSYRLPAKPFMETKIKQFQSLPMEKIASEIDFSHLKDIAKWYTAFLAPLRRLSSEKKSALVTALSERIAEAEHLLKLKYEETRSFEASEKIANTTLVYHALCRNPELTKEGLANVTGLSRATVTRMLQKLVSENKICRIGANKNGKWEII